MNLTHLDSKVAVGRQPRIGELEGLARAGFRGLINNRPDGEDPDQPSSGELRTEAQRLGMTYCHIPVRPGEATPDDARAFAAAVRAASGPVFAFCRSGNRARQLWQMAQQLS